ncbi:MAG TPA: endo-1,4-beta-xylanase, partial [Dysgonamonadaceae bacterium]|nr:endo-1,4-beta-xylanase [Dysgonamonadaceae bacterium]
MKYCKKFSLIGFFLTLLISCADNTRLEYVVEKPQSLAQREYLNDYDVLKAYVDRTKNPAFKLGAGVSVSDFNAKGLMYRLICSNFDEMTAGWEMKHGAIVQKDGSLNLSNVESFIATAKEAGITIYGHTLCWHANQNANYLNGLLKPTVIPGEPGWDVIAKLDFETNDASHYTYNQNAIVSFTAQGEGANGKGRALKITNEQVRTNDWDCQFFVTFSPPMELG